MRGLMSIDCCMNLYGDQCFSERNTHFFGWSCDLEIVRWILCVYSIQCWGFLQANHAHTGSSTQLAGRQTTHTQEAVCSWLAAAANVKHTGAVLMQQRLARSWIPPHSLQAARITPKVTATTHCLRTAALAAAVCFAHVKCTGDSQTCTA